MTKLALSIALAIATLVGLAPAASAAALIADFSPTAGPVGTSVTITGSGFAGTTSVEFGGVAATTFSVDDDSAITATVPATAVTGPITVVTPTGDGTSSTNFSVLPSDIHAPRITGFNPHSGPVTSLVTVTGEHFIAIEKVKIGKLSVGWDRLSGSKLRFRVPTKSKGGRILVRTADGSDTSGTGFNVRKDMHKSTITFSLSGHLVGSGTVRSRDNDGVCRTQRHVVVQRRYGGGWHGVRNDRTSPNGTYHVSLTDTEGVYRAVVGSKSTLKDRCSGANSDARKHHHADAGGGGGGGCTAGYSPCLPLGPSDYDCYGGGGDGPAYTEPGVTYHVTGSDPYGLDADNDGRGCET